MSIPAAGNQASASNGLQQFIESLTTFVTNNPALCQEIVNIASDSFRPQDQFPAQLLILATAITDPTPHPPHPPLEPPMVIDEVEQDNSFNIFMQKLDLNAVSSTPLASSSGRPIESSPSIFSSDSAAFSASFTPSPSVDLSISSTAQDATSSQRPSLPSISLFNLSSPPSRQVLSDVSTAQEIFADEPDIDLSISDKSVHVDFSSCPQPTLHDLMLESQTLLPSVGHPISVGIRDARGNEVATALNEETTLKELILDYDMPRSIIELSRIHDDKAECILSRELTQEELQRLTYGFQIGNGHQQTFGEQDNQFLFSVGEALFVSEAVNMLDHDMDLDNPNRVYPHAARIGHVMNPRTREVYIVRPDVELEHQKHTVEIKTDKTLDQGFLPKLFHMTQASLQDYSQNETRPLLFQFQSPKGEGGDKMGIHTQLIYQVWTQMCAKNVHFAQASSRTWTFFAIRDPQHPNRMYISPCLATFNTQTRPFPAPSNSEERRNESQAIGPNVGLYVMLHLGRISRSDTTVAQFLASYGPAVNQARPVSVHFRHRANADVSPVILDSMPGKTTVGPIFYSDRQLRQQDPKVPSQTGDVSTETIDDNVSAGDMEKVSIPPKKGSARIKGKGKAVSLPGAMSSKHSEKSQITKGNKKSRNASEIDENINVAGPSAKVAQPVGGPDNDSESVPKIKRNERAAWRY